jgi:hypothetical protein
MAKQQLTLEFGANYLPHVDSIRDFFPHWIEPRWDEARVARDLKILRSLGSRWMRYHILPTDYSRDRYPAADAERYRRLVPHALRTCRELGMKTHIDLHTDDFRSLKASDLLARIDEFGAENIDVLQVINEYFYLWKSKENLDHLQTLLTAVRASGFAGHLCFDAGGAAHRQIRISHPELAEFVSDMLPVHHYTYGWRWDDLGIATFLDLLTDGRRALEQPLLPEQREYWQSMLDEHFSGLAKRLHLMEINSVGFHLWQGFVRGERAGRWQELMHRVASETTVAVVGHWCFRTKISWREYGLGNCGLLYASEMPRPEVNVFRQTAIAMMPTDDVYAAFELNVTPAEEGRITATIRNKTSNDVSGVLVDPAGKEHRLLIVSNGQQRMVLDAAPTKENGSAVQHQFVEFVPLNAGKQSGRCIGWCACLQRRPIQLHERVTYQTPDVVYPDGTAPVRDFLDGHSDRLAIVAEHPAALESELGMRLQCAITEAWGIEPELVSTSIDAEDALRERAVILLLVRGQNAMARCVERLLGKRYVDFPGPRGAGASISAHLKLFTRPPADPAYPTASAMHTIGDTTFSPGAVVLLASSFETLRHAVHNLIQRIEPPERTARAYEKGERERYGGLLLSSPSRFGVIVPHGDYDVSIAIGSWRFGKPTATHVKFAAARIDRQFHNHQDLEWIEQTAEFGGLVEVEFNPLEGLAACPAALVFTDRRTGGRVFKCYFHHAPRVDMDYEGYSWVNVDTFFGKEVQCNDWANIRSSSNEFVAQASRFGWLDSSDRGGADASKE